MENQNIIKNMSLQHEAIAKFMLGLVACETAKEADVYMEGAYMAAILTLGSLKSNITQLEGTN